jgi:translation elongation factor EF-Ts
MENVTLEKVDMVRERTGVGYEKAKQALEACEGDVLEALIYIEKTQNILKTKDDSFNDDENKNTISIEELKAWFKQMIEKGNVARIKIKKDETELIDIPVNAGIAASVVAIIIPPILAAGVIAAIATQITIEITKEDGSVEIVNQQVSKVANDVKNKANDFADKVKNKVNEMKKDTNNDSSDSKQKVYTGSDTVYTYTVNFDEEKENSEN